MFNILYLSHTGSAIGGGENQLVNLVKNLNRASYNPIVICPNSGEFSSRLEYSGIPVHICHLSATRKAGLYLFRRFAAMRLAKIAGEKHIDLIHASDLWQNYYAWRVGSSLKIPVISHARNYLRPERVHKYLFDRFDRIIAISERVKEPLVLAGIPPEKIKVVTDGVDVSEFSPDVGELNVLRSDYSLHKYTVGLVGRIEPFKRQKDFVEVASEIVKVRNDVSFLIIGDPLSKSSAYFREVQQAIEDYDVAECIIFTGYRRDMPEVLNSLDILVTLSGGSVMLEAMACGRPVISASKANPADLIMVRDGEAGLVVPYDDIRSISRAILRLLDDEDMRNRMGKAGRKRVEELFSIKRMSELTQSVYRELLSGNKGS